MNLTDEEVKLIDLKIEEFNKSDPHWRVGQTYFNALFIVNPSIANEIRATKLDMFYLDENISKFREVLGVE